MALQWVTERELLTTQPTTRRLPPRRVVSSFPMPDSTYQSDHVFDGGDMDCGSGLILLIRENMQRVPAGGILELTSREPTVTGELPPWCRMVGHEYLETIETEPGKHWRHFVRRGGETGSEAQALEDDKQKARDYHWRVRTRHTGNQEATVYARRFSWKLGQPASFEEKDDHPCALEAALGALLSDLLNGFASRCLQQGKTVDELEGNLRASLHNVLAHVGLEDGDPSLREIKLSAFITSPDPGEELRRVWEDTLARSPLYRTFSKACPVEARLAIL